MSLDTEISSRLAPAPRGWLKRGLAALMLSGLAACAVGPLVGSVILAIVLARRGDLHAVLRLRRRPGRGFVYLVPRGH